MLPDEAWSIRESVHFIDVREFYEFDAGHIEGATHIPLRTLPGRFEDLDRDRPVIVACQIGQRSALAADFLRERGFDAHNLEGGMTLWAAQGLPFVSNLGDEGQVVDGWAQPLE
ncbi:MAG: rhodanese-like domain-containing protein [Actinobacteria bacterium]|nr:rhodanese-like domain-containing protein [Actinomycetota bacterium]